MSRKYRRKCALRNPSCSSPLSVGFASRKADGLDRGVPESPLAGRKICGMILGCRQRAGHEIPSHRPSNERVVAAEGVPEGGDLRDARPVRVARQIDHDVGSDRRVRHEASGCCGDALLGNVVRQKLVREAKRREHVPGITGSRVVGKEAAPPPPPPPSASDEPNDSIGTATAVTLSSGAATMSGTIGDGAYTTADVDIYSVNLAAGAVLTVDIDAATLGSSLDSYVRVFDASGAQVAFNDDSGGSYDSLVTFTAPSSETYFIGVSSYGNSTYFATTAGSGRAGSSTGNYTATIGVTVPALPPPTADIIDVSPDPRTTSVSAIVVQFSRAVNGLDTADFSLTRDGTAVSLAGASVTTTDNIRWTLAGLDAATATAGGYVLTLDASGSGIVAVDGGAARVTSASDTWTTQAATLVDAGDTLAKAAVLGITSGDVRLSGRIGDGSFGAKDVDLYKVTLAAGQTITIDIDARTLSGGSTLDSFVRLFNASGKQVAANDDDGSSYDSLLAFRAKTAGTYYVGISGYGNSGYNPTRAGSGRAGSTGVYQVGFALTTTTAGRAGARIAGARDSASAARLTAFAMYGANWSAALPASASSPVRPRRR